MTTKEIEIGSNKKAFVVLNDRGVEVGTISQYARGAAWVVYRGIGNEAAPVGNRPTKKEAIALLK